MKNNKKEKIIEDYQWMLCKANGVNYSKNLNRLQEGSEKKIQDFFEKIFQSKVFLAPSGRNAIATILGFYGANRTHLTYAPAWSSLCVWEAICRYTNPTIEINGRTNFAVIVNKWGYPTAPPHLNGIKTIADSVDNLIQSPKALFTQNNDFEIISLPKVIGSYAGALIVTKDKNFESYLHERKKINHSGAKLASQRKFQKYIENKNVTWSELDFDHYGLDLNAINHIEKNLKNYPKNLVLAKERVSRIYQEFDKKILPKQSLETTPICVPLKMAKQLKTTPSSLLIRNFDFNQSCENPNFEKALIIPTHLSITNKKFDQLIAEAKALL